MLNALWLTMFCAAIVAGAATNRLDEVARASMESANQAVTLALGLVGAMCLWLGLVRVLHEAGVMRALARGMRPIFVWLFPEVPPEHPALGMMVLNMASNALGLGNAATPFGLSAMRKLDQLNPHPGVASNAMVVFLAINTSGLAVLPTGMIALRASLGSHAPGAIFVPTLLATFSAAIAGVVAARLLARLPRFRLPAPSRELANAAAALAPNASGTEPRITANAADPDAAQDRARSGAALVAPEGGKLLWTLVVVGLLVGSFGYATYQLTVRPELPLSWGAALRQAVSGWSLLVLMGGFVAVGVGRGVRIYDAVVEGGREGFDVALRIIPYLTAILVVVGMLRASGAIDASVLFLAPITNLVGMPAEALPMALLRPLTGTGAYAIAADTMRVYGPDSLAGEVASTIMGTTETTFYVLALYLGTVGVRKARHALWTCLVADVTGTLVAVWSCRLLLH